jgi:hypothetical protein
MGTLEHVAAVAEKPRQLSGEEIDATVSLNGALASAREESRAIIRARLRVAKEANSRGGVLRATLDEVALNTLRRRGIRFP